MDLSPLMKRDEIQLNDLQKILVEQASDFDGKLFQLSPTFNRDIMLVNRKLLRELGIAEPEGPMNWEQFRQSAAVIEEREPDAVGYAIDYYYHSALEWAGENIMGWDFIENNELMLDRPEWRFLFEQLYNDTFEKSFNSAMLPPKSDKYIQQKVGYFFTRATFLNTLANDEYSLEDWAVAELPKDPSNTQLTPFLPMQSLSINSESPYTEEVWQLVVYLMSREAASRIAEDNLMFGFVTYPEELAFNDSSNQGLFKMNGTVSNQSTIQLTHKANQQLSDAFINSFSAVANGGLSFDQGWEEIQEVVQSINRAADSFTNE